jgi:ABC-type multidrug transport system fused ATPase/permease subunit
VKNPPILILDEATSSLDTLTEREVQAAINTARSGRTVLCIAHRLSTVRDADEIIVLHAGAIAERGTHDQLLAARGRYHALWQQQAAAATGATADGAAAAVAAPVAVADDGTGVAGVV